jgi:methenyltetrahydromethanopterin cyclohydrolase
MTTTQRPSVNRLAAPLVERLVGDAAALRLGVERAPSGAVIVDAGIDVVGGIQAGRRIVEICMGGLGQVRIAAQPRFAHWPWTIEVGSMDPVTSCLASQLAGWSLSHGEGSQGFFALGSGPGRALARREPLFEQLGYGDEADSACLVLEVDKRPPAPLIEKAAADCGVAPERLTLILTPTRSLAGTVQIAGRVLEVALHKLLHLQFPLAHVVDGLGTAPLPPPAPSFVEAMGRTNDAIIYGGLVHLFVTGADEAAERLAAAMPSGGSRDYGRPFAETFKAYKGKFYDIDPQLFSPALVHVTNLDSGRTFHGGALDEALLDLSFGDGARA